MKPPTPRSTNYEVRIQTAPTPREVRWAVLDSETGEWIEVEPPRREPLDVERLARAMDRADPPVDNPDHEEEDHLEHLAYARDIAAEYARLAEADR